MSSFLISRCINGTNPGSRNLQMSTKSTSLKSVMRNTSFLLLGEIISKPLLFLAMVYLARVLSPDGFGKVNFALAIITYFILLSNMGVSLLGTRDIARQKDRIGYYINNIISLRLCLSALGISIILTASLVLDSPDEILELILIYSLGLVPLSFFLDWVFQGQEEMGYIAASRIITNGVNIVLIFCLIRSPEQLMLVPWCQVCGQMAASLFLLLSLKRRFRFPRLSFQWKAWWTIIRPSLPMGAALFMNQIILNLDTVMIGLMKGDYDVGLYQAAYQIVFFLIIISNAYFDAVFPVLSKYFEISLHALRQIQILSARIVSMIGLPLAVGGTFLATEIIILTFGAEYAGGTIPFKILIWSVFLILINNIYSRGLLACNRQKDFLLVLLVQALVNIGFNFILIPPWGLMGAGISTILAEGAGFILYAHYFNKITRIALIPHLVKPFLASGLMLVCIWTLSDIFHLGVILVVSLGVLAYFLSMLLMGGIRLSELRHLASGGFGSEKVSND